MRILLAHNYYLQAGGEDVVYESDKKLLRSNNHDVFEYTEDNKKISSMNKVAFAANTVWSRSSYINMKKVVEKFKPDVVNIYNFFPLISPSVYYACREFGTPVIQYLFNPRLICPAASLYRNQKLCTKCIGKIPPWPGILHACYHNSRIETFVVSSMTTVHHLIKTWHSAVDIFISATEFYRNLYIEGGLPAKKIIVKPNYISNAPEVSIEKTRGTYALFIARLDSEKGVKTLLSAWKTLNFPLKIRGNGQEEEKMRDFVQQNNMTQVEFIERLEEVELANLRKNSRFFVWPSEGYYETFGLAAVECFAQGIPVIASNLGVMAEIVRDGETGLLFNPGDPADLAKKVNWLWNHPEESEKMGRNARREYEEKYTPERSYQMLMDIYKKVILNKKVTV